MQTKNGAMNANTHSPGQGNFPLTVDSSNPFGNSGGLYGEKKNTDSSGIPRTEEARSSELVLSSAAKIKVIGVGGGGGNAVERMIASEVAGADPRPARSSGGS